MFLLTHVSLRCKLFSFLCVLIGATLLESFAYNGFCAHSLNISLSYFFNFFFCARHSVECNNSRVWIKKWSLRINYRTLSCFTISSTKCIWMIIVLTCFLIPVSIGAKWKKKFESDTTKIWQIFGNKWTKNRDFPKVVLCSTLLSDRGHLCTISVARVWF